MESAELMTVNPEGKIPSTGGSQARTRNAALMQDSEPNTITDWAIPDPNHLI